MCYISSLLQRKHELSHILSQNLNLSRKFALKNSPDSLIYFQVFVENLHVNKLKSFANLMVANKHPALNWDYKLINQLIGWNKIFPDNSAEKGAKETMSTRIREWAHFTD